MTLRATGTGMLLGKFYPFHKGHEYLINFAANYVNTLYVFVCSTSYEKIPGEIRERWVRENQQKNLNVIIVPLREDLPQTPDEHPDFWNIWKDRLTTKVGRNGYDYVFASEEYGEKLAQVLNGQFIAVDVMRQNFPVSGSNMREDLYSNWKMLTPEVQKYYQKTICIAGPESTGKTTLTKFLAAKFNAASVPEYGRIYFDNITFKRPEYKCLEEDLDVIVRGHRASIESINNYNSPVKFVDTDAIATKLFGLFYFGSYPKVIDEYIATENYDLTILLYPDTDYVNDGMRDLPDIREEFFDKYAKELKKSNRKFIKIFKSNLTFDERNDIVYNVIDEFLKKELIMENIKND